MHAIDIQPLTANDIPELERWHKDAELAGRYGGANWPRVLWGIMQRDSQRQCFIAWRSGSRIGYVDWELHPAENLAWIGLAVDPSVRHQGLGKKILRSFLSAPVARAFPEIRAGIEHDNAVSIRCFVSVGFRPISGVPDEEGIIDYVYMHAM